SLPFFCSLFLSFLSMFLSHASAQHVHSYGRCLQNDELPDERAADWPRNWDIKVLVFPGNFLGNPQLLSLSLSLSVSRTLCLAVSHPLSLSLSPSRSSNPP